MCVCVCVFVCVCVCMGSLSSRQGFIQDFRFGEKTRLRNRLSDSGLEHLMKIAIEGPSISNVHFNEILDIFKQKNIVVIMLCILL